MNDVGCSHQARAPGFTLRSKSAARCSSVTCHPNLAFRVVMMMSWCQLWKKSWNMSGTCIINYVSRPSSLYDVIVLEQISGNRGGLTEDVALSLGIIVRCLGDSETVHTSMSQVWQRWKKHRWNDKRLTEMISGILGPGHIGRMLNLANQCGNLRATTTLKVNCCFILFYSINIDSTSWKEGQHHFLNQNHMGVEISEVQKPEIWSIPFHSWAQDGSFHLRGRLAECWKNYG